MDEPDYLEHAGFFADSRSPEETDSRKRRIDQINADLRTRAAAGPFSAAIASVAANATDPTMLLPGRIGVSILKSGMPFLRSAVELSGAAAIQAAAQDMLIRQSQPDRPPSETIMSIGSATIMGSVLGPALIGRRRGSSTRGPSRAHSMTPMSADRQQEQVATVGPARVE
jgi:hypothetical protein